VGLVDVQVEGLYTVLVATLATGLVEVCVTVE
jgi:hypothetical protein